jgi:hypothetical protein
MTLAYAAKILLWSAVRPLTGICFSGKSRISHAAPSSGAAENADLVEYYKGRKIWFSPTSISRGLIYMETNHELPR